MKMPEVYPPSAAPASQRLVKGDQRWQGIDNRRPRTLSEPIVGRSELTLKLLNGRLLHKAYKQAFEDG